MLSIAGTLLAFATTAGSIPLASFTTTGSYLSTNFDKIAYNPGDTIHISGSVFTPGCTWTYTASLGLAVELSIYDPDRSLILSTTTDATTAIYGSYAYDYALRTDAVPGTYSVSISSKQGPWLCDDGPILGGGTFQVTGNPSTQSISSHTSTVEQPLIDMTTLAGLGLVILISGITYVIVRRERKQRS